MSVVSVLNTYGQIAVDVLRQSIPDATGKTQQSLRYVVDEQEEQLIIIGREFTSLLEKGRKPTKKNPSPEMIENLTDYARARGFENPERAAWAIAKKINRDGDKTHRQGGRVLWSDDLDNLVKNLAQDLAEDAAKEILKEIKQETR